MDERVGRYLDLWLASLNLSRQSLKTYRFHVRQFLEWADESGVDVLNATPGDILSYKAALRARELSVRTTRARTQVLDLFYRWMAATGHISRAPTANLTHDPAPPTAGSRLSLEEIQAIWAASTKRAFDRAAVGLLGICCLTPDEVAHASVAHLSRREGHRVLRLPRRRHTIPGADFVPLPKDLVTALDEHKGDRTAGPLLLNRYGSEVTGPNLRRLCARVARQAGISRLVTPQMLTFTGRWLAIDSGFGLTATMTLLPKADARFLAPYLRSAVVSLDQHPAFRLARIVDAGGSETDRILDEAASLLNESGAPPAAAVALAGATLERHLRALTQLAGRKVDVDRADLGTYGAQLRGANVFGNDEVQLLAQLQTKRNDAAHGWFERIDRDSAQDFIRHVGRLLASHPLT